MSVACQMVGVYYNTGTGFPKDQARALQYFDKACAAAVQVRMTSIKEFKSAEE